MQVNRLSALGDTGKKFYCSYGSIESDRNEKGIVVGRN